MTETEFESNSSIAAIVKLYRWIMAKDHRQGMAAYAILLLTLLIILYYGVR